VNDAGVVAETKTLSNGSHAFRYFAATGSEQDLGLGGDGSVSNQDLFPFQGSRSQGINSTNQVVGNFEVGSPEWPALVAQGNAIWISAPLDNIVAKFDPGTGAIASTVRAGSRPQEFAFLGNNLWVANYLDGTVVKLSVN
jgi:DNA-binding beta-propeller fold protein YncE